MSSLTRKISTPLTWFKSRSIPAQAFIWTLLVLVITAMLGAGLIINAKQTNGIANVIEAGAQGGSGIVLLGHVFNIDIPSRQVDISWLIVGCGDLQEEGTTSYGVSNCGRLSVPTDFFVDGSSEPNGTFDPASIPYTTDGNSLQYVQALNEFQTTHLLYISAWNGLDQQYAYPFDTYFLDTSFIAFDSNTNQSYDILSLSPIDSTNSFYTDIQQQWATTINMTSISVGGRYMKTMFRRTMLTQFFIMAMFLVNWGLTLVVLYISVAASDGRKVNESILVLPLSVILTIPALRALWVGAPAFGLMLDTVGLFVQMLVVAICSIYLVVVIGLGNKGDGQPAGNRGYTPVVAQPESLDYKE